MIFESFWWKKVCLVLCFSSMSPLLIMAVISLIIKHNGLLLTSGKMNAHDASLKSGKVVQIRLQLNLVPRPD